MGSVTRMTAEEEARIDRDIRAQDIANVEKILGSLAKPYTIKDKTARHGTPEYLEIPGIDPAATYRAMLEANKGVPRAVAGNQQPSLIHRVPGDLRVTPESLRGKTAISPVPMGFKEEMAQWEQSQKGILSRMQNWGDDVWGSFFDEDVGDAAVAQAKASIEQPWHEEDSQAMPPAWAVSPRIEQRSSPTTRPILYGSPQQRSAPTTRPIVNATPQQRSAPTTRPIVGDETQQRSSPSTRPTPSGGQAATSYTENPDNLGTGVAPKSIGSYTNDDWAAFNAKVTAGKAARGDYNTAGTEPSLVPPMQTEGHPGAMVDTIPQARVSTPQPRVIDNPEAAPQRPGFNVVKDGSGNPVKSGNGFMWSKDYQHKMWEN